MSVVLFAHICTPFLAGLVVLGMVVLAKKEIPTWSEANDAALDLTILSIGATGPLLLEPTVRQAFEPSMAVYGILLVLLNLVIACALVARRKWKTNLQLTLKNCALDFLLGSCSVGMIAMAFYIAYNTKGGTHAG